MSPAKNVHLRTSSHILTRCVGDRTRSLISRAHSSDECISPLLSAYVNDWEAAMARALEHGENVAHELDFFKHHDVARLSDEPIDGYKL